MATACVRLLQIAILRNKVCWLAALISTIAPTALLAQQAGASADDWRLEKNKNGIQVYTRHLTDSRLKEVKVLCDIEGTLPQLVAYISDIDHYPETVYRVAEAHVVRRVGDSELYFYNRTAMPWPASDRDLVIHMVFQMDPATRTLFIKANNASGVVPEKKGIVRVPFWRSSWAVKAIDSKRIRIDYRFAVDPGGIPVWLVNSLAAMGPYQAFEGLEKVLKRPYYQNRTFPFLP